MRRIYRAAVDESFDKYKEARRAIKNIRDECGTIRHDVVDDLKHYQVPANTPMGPPSAMPQPSPRFKASNEPSVSDCDGSGCSSAYKGSRDLERQRSIQNWNGGTFLPSPPASRPRQDTLRD